jgi:hypothetical protein
MDKRKQRRIINDLLDQCGDCPKRLIAGKPDTICGHCTLYHKIRAEGKKLGADGPRYKTRVKINLTVPEYWKLHNDGITDEAIAFAKDVSPQQVASWKKRHGISSKRVRRTSISR